MIKKSLQRSSVVAALLLTGTVAFAQLGVVVAGSSPKAASSALLLTSASAAIKACAFESRPALLADIDSRLRAAGEAMAALVRDARPPAGDAREVFEAALKDVKAQEHTLQQHLHAARKAKAADWPSQRALLASSYGDYAGAVARLEAAAAGGTPE